MNIMSRNFQIRYSKRRRDASINVLEGDFSIVTLALLLAGSEVAWSEPPQPAASVVQVAIRPLRCRCQDSA